MWKIVLGSGFALILTLAGCSSASTPQTPPSSLQSPSTAAAPITSAQIVTIGDGMQWALALTDAATAFELRTGAQKIDDLVPRDKIWFATANVIGSDIIKLRGATFKGSSFSAVNVAEMKRIAIEIQTAIDHGDKP